MSGTYWPLHAGEGEERTGLEAELAHLIASHLRKESVEFLGRAELGMSALEAVAQGKVDVAIASLTPTPERARTVDFTQPYLKLGYRLVGRVGASATPLKGRRVGVPRGPASEQLRAALGEATVVEVPTLAEGFRQLRKKKLELLAGEDVGLLELMDETKESLVGEALGESALAIAVPKGRGAEYDAILAGLAPSLRTLVDRYRPGQPHREVRLAPCGASPLFMVATVDPPGLTAKGTPAEAVFLVDGAGLGAARPGGELESEGLRALCASRPVRYARFKPPASAAKLIARDLRTLRRELETEQPPRDAVLTRNIQVEWAAPFWVALAEGARLGVYSYAITQDCVRFATVETGADGPEEYSEEQRQQCPAAGHYLVLVKGQQSRGAAIRALQPPDTL